MERPFSIRPPWPVSFLLALSIVALAVPLLAFLGMEASRLASSERARLFGEVRVGAERIAADIDQTLNGYIAILETLATTPALAEGDYATVYRQAQAALGSRGLYAFLRDLDGRQLFNTRLPFGAPLPHTSGFEPAHLWRPHVSDVVVGAVAHRPVMAASVPVLFNGQIRYVLSLSLDPALMKDLLDRQQLPPEWRATIADSKGVMIARSRLHDENVGKVMTTLKGVTGSKADASSPDLEGRTVKWGTAPSRVAAWNVYVSVPSANVEDAARNALLNYVLIVAVFTCVGIAGAVDHAPLLPPAVTLLVTAQNGLALLLPAIDSRDDAHVVAIEFADIDTSGHVLTHAPETKHAAFQHIFRSL